MELPKPQSLIIKPLVYIDPVQIQHITQLSHSTDKIFFFSKIFCGEYLSKTLAVNRITHIRNIA